MEKTKLQKALGEGFIFYAFSTLTLSIQFLLYLLNSPRLSMMDAGGWLFYVTAACSHAALWMLIPYAVSAVAAVASRGGKAAAITHIILATLLNIAAYIDGSVYSLYKFHINGFVLSLFFGEGNSEIFTFGPVLYLKMAGVVLAALAANTLLRILAGRCHAHFRRCGLRPVVATLLLFTLFSHLYHAYSAVVQKTSVMRSASCLPYYFPLTATSLMIEAGVVPADKTARANLENRGKSTDIAYPIHPLTHHGRATGKNIVLIVIDSWNSRSFNSEVMPCLSRFAERCSKFESHLSSSNGTRGSIFGLFYSLPSVYWTDFETSGLQPLLIEELLAQGYRIGIHPSANIINPPFAKVLFSKVPHLRTHTEGETVYDRDCRITADCLQALDTADNDAKPFFSFLFYDLAHGFELPKEKLHRFRPSWEFADYMKLNNDTDPTPFLNLYNNCLAQVDSLAGRVLQKLEERQLLDNTLVIVTGDHGQEFNENHKNYWGHGSNYSPAQVRVPFLLYTPGKEPGIYRHRTTHYDLVPTLMAEVLGVSNPPSDYGMGHLLTDTCAREWHVVGSHLNYAFIVENNTILEKLPSGYIEICDSAMNPLDNYKIDPRKLDESIRSLNRFYK